MRVLLDSIMMKNFRFCLLVIFGLGLTGCSSVEYYWQAVEGHTDILNREQPIEQILQEPDLDPELRGYLEEIQQARDFASNELGLPDNDSYRN